MIGIGREMQSTPQIAQAEKNTVTWKTHLDSEQRNNKFFNEPGLFTVIKTSQILAQ